MGRVDNDLPRLLSALPDRVEEMIGAGAKRTPDAVAVLEHETAWTYRQLAEAIAESRFFLAKSGLRAGDRLVIVGENSLTLVALFFAACGLRAWPVVVSGRLSQHEIDAITCHADPRLTIFLTRSSPTTRAHAERAEARPIALPLTGTFAIGARNDMAIPEPLPLAEEVALLLYTSGSTGQPKSVMLTHRNLLHMAAISGAIRQVAPADRFLCVLPLSHIVGLSVLLLGALLHGASIDLRMRFQPAEILDALRNSPISIVLGTPAMYALLLDYAKRQSPDGIEAAALRIISVSGAPLDPTMKREVEHYFRLPLHHGYGITECSPTIAQVRPEDPRDDCSVGPLIPGLEAKLVDSAGAPLPAGEAGELWVRGATVMKGYYKAPDETRQVLDPEGWFRTGDLVRIEDGYLTIVGRAKEMIIRFGFNVSPAEVEAALMEHPAVAQAAVVGRARTGEEEIVAFVRPVPEIALSPRDLSSFLAGRLSSYKQPTEIFILQQMPTTTSGKILKSALATMAQGAGR